MKNYLKSVVANKITLAGYSLMGLGAVTEFFGIKSMISGYDILFIGLSLNNLTLYGFQTRTAYKRTIQHIDSYNTLDPRFLAKHRWYCEQVGIRAAAKERNLEHLLMES